MPPVRQRAPGAPEATSLLSSDTINRHTTCASGGNRDGQSPFHSLLQAYQCLGHVGTSAVDRRGALVAMIEHRGCQAGLPRRPFTRQRRRLVAQQMRPESDAREFSRDACKCPAKAAWAVGRWPGIFARLA